MFEMQRVALNGKRIVLAAVLGCGMIFCTPARSQPPAEPPRPPAEPLTALMSDCPGRSVQDELFKPMENLVATLPEDEGLVPRDCSQDLFLGHATRPLPVEQVFFWEPTNLLYHPPYFDDVPLEHYGQSIHPLLQPGISGARFFGTFALLPAKVIAQPIHSCITDMGFYRPGVCAPCIRERIVLTRAQRKR